MSLSALRSERMLRDRRKRSKMMPTKKRDVRNNCLVASSETSPTEHSPVYKNTRSKKALIGECTTCGFIPQKKSMHTLSKYLIQSSTLLVVSSVQNEICSFIALFKGIVICSLCIIDNNNHAEVVSHQMKPCQSTLKFF